MKSSFRLVVTRPIHVACCVGYVVIWCVAMAATPPGLASREPPGLSGVTAIHPERLAHARPSQGKSAEVNPPPLLWPAREKGSRYAVRLSQDPAFPPDETIAAANLPWAMFNPHRGLPAGTWHWQYGTLDRSGRPEWSEVHRFKVDDSTRAFVTPAVAAMLAGVPKEHPRVLVPANQLPAVRQRWEKTGELARLLQEASRLVGGRLPSREKILPAEKGKDAFEARSFAKWASKGYASKLAAAVGVLVPAYLATGDEQIGREAVRRGLFVADLDSDGDTSPKVSDFADGSCMRAMAHVYGSTSEFTAVSTKEGRLGVGTWTIDASLDPSRPASLTVRRTDGKAALLADGGQVSVGGKQYAVPQGESLLVESEAGIVERCTDELPAAAR